MLVKVDLAKAYDRIRWSFLQSVLSDAGQPESLIQTIMLCQIQGCSFSLNYESTLLIAAGPLLDQLDRLAQNYMAVSHELTLERWDQRPWYRRYVDNVMKLTSALQ